MEMNGLVARALALGLAVVLDLGQAPPPGPGPDIAPDVSRAIDSLFARWNSTALPGCTIGVTRDGRQVVSRAYGMADLEHAIANQPDSIIEAGSVSKQFTAAAILLLAQQGKLSLDDPVREHIPELPDYGVPLTIRHLITHTSGLRDWGTIAAIAGWPRTSRAYTHAHVLDIVSRQKALNFAPGTEFSYSNTGYNLAAIVVSRVTGRTFAEYTREAIFEPLGMTRTSWRDDFTRIVRDRSIAYTVGDAGVTTNMPFENVHGNGGLLTTVSDLLRWNENAFSARVGGRAFVDLQRTRGRLNSGESIVYSAGLYIGEWNGVPEINHSGGTAGYRAWLAQYPTQRRLSVAILCNASDAPAWTIGRQVADLFLAAPRALPDSSFRPAARALAELPGLYRDLKTHVVMTIEMKAGELRGAGGTLIPVSTDSFRFGSGAIRLTVGRLPSGAIAGVEVNTLGEISRFERVEASRPASGELAAYAGEYASDEAEVTLHVAVHDGQLEIRRRPDVRIPLTANHLDGFSGTIGQVRFIRNRQGTVTEMSISNDRVWDLRLTRSAGTMKPGGV
jgi:CubicO group peptidase (beta-lactamase class C family)